MTFLLLTWPKKKTASLLPKTVIFLKRTLSMQAADALKKQLKEMLQQVASSVQKIQQLATENEQLKRENQQLKQLLPQRLQQQPA
ncbi:MAG: hypothetical protein KF852_01815 [Saprospiraceae bacterium]|nr:hypothetical protein [Saprospiraceae bacterium]